MLTTGGYHTCGVTKPDETSINILKCWGLVDDGQIGWADGQNTLGGAPDSRRLHAGSHVLVMACAIMSLFQVCQ
jgi:hypothetical protein